MSTIVPRLYQNEETAKEAVNALLKARFWANEITVVTAATPDITAAIVGAGVFPKHAAIYAPRVSEGAALVVVQARVLMAVAANRVLRRFSPVDVGIDEPDYFEPSSPGDIPKVISGPPTTKLLDSSPSGNLLSSDFYLTGFMGLVSNMAPMAKVTAGGPSLPFATISHSPPFSKVSAGGPSLPLPTVIRDEEDQ